ncbi:hypothetical protein C4565_03385 [Candidatus Parcubacteria bacterium]|jgi:hypothetical protein|nr:MAG: hypothetical protein C4565_03385 [Candidatus Parcubacteria bacterium]
MEQSATKLFHAALCHLLNREGRGSQSRLSAQQNIDRGYLNAIVKGRKPGSEQARAKIAAYFRMTYEEMLSLGRNLLLDTSGESIEGKKWTIDDEGIEKSDSKVGSSHTVSSISECLRKTVEILGSDSICREVFAGLIDAFYEAISTQQVNHALQAELSEMKQRIACLEKELGESKCQLKKSA